MTGNRELDATLHILAAPLLWDRVHRFVGETIGGSMPDSSGIDFPAMIDDGWSSSERAMIEIACTMWGREDLYEGRLSAILFTLDDTNLARVLEAIWIRRGKPAGWPS